MRAEDSNGPQGDPARHDTVKRMPGSTQNCDCPRPNDSFLGIRRLEPVSYPFVITTESSACGMPRFAACMAGMQRSCLISATPVYFLAVHRCYLSYAVGCADRANCRVLMMSDESTRSLSPTRSMCASSASACDAKRRSPALAGRARLHACKSSSEWRDGIAA